MPSIVVYGASGYVGGTRDNAELWMIGCKADEINPSTLYKRHQTCAPRLVGDRLRAQHTARK